MTRRCKFAHHRGCSLCVGKLWHDWWSPSKSRGRVPSRAQGSLARAHKTSSMRRVSAAMSVQQESAVKSGSRDDEEMQVRTSSRILRAYDNRDSRRLEIAREVGSHQQQNVRKGAYEKEELQYCRVRGQDMNGRIQSILQKSG